LAQVQIGQLQSGQQGQFWQVMGFSPLGAGRRLHW
jgi:hypothetical protein